MSARQVTPSTSDAHECERVEAKVWRDLAATARGADRLWPRAPLGPCADAGLLSPSIKLVRDPGTVNAARTTLEIGAASGRDAEAAAAVLEVTLGLRPDIAQLFCVLAQRPHWHLLIARDAGKVVAAATLFVSDASGYLFTAGTLPSHRRRGAQAALIERRLRIGFALGCTRLFCETPADGAGPLHGPVANLVRAGFRPLAGCAKR